MDDKETAHELEAAQLLTQIYELWVQPELDRRGLDIPPEQLTKALVVMAPNRQVAVLLDDEVELVANVRASRQISKGETLTSADFDDLRGLSPVRIDPDAGWVCFGRIAGTTYVAFDFRRNREKARRMLVRAEEFLAAALDAWDAGRMAVAIDSGYGAAELAVTAQMLLIQDSPVRDHQRRRQWWSEWTKLGNAPTEQGRAFAYLAARRGPARYADGSLRVRSAHLHRQLGVVGETIAHARATVGASLPQL